MSFLAAIIYNRKIRRIFIAVLIVILIGGYVVFGRGKKNELPLVKVTRGDIVQEVSVTGRVKATQNVSLAFERAGKIAHTYADVGTHVEAGQTLMDFSADDLYAQERQAEAGVEVSQAQLTQYRAALDSQKAKLDELARGTRGEELKIAETKVFNAKHSLADAQSNAEKVTNKATVDLANAFQSVPDALIDAYIKVDDAVRTKTAGTVSGSFSQGYLIAFAACDAVQQTRVASLRYDAESELVAWKSQINALAGTSDQTKLDAALQLAQKHLAIIAPFLQGLNALLTAPCLLSNTSYDGQRTTLNTALVNFNVALVEVDSARRAIDSQKATNESAAETAQAKMNDAANALASAQDELALKKAGTAREEITIQKAAVRQAEATVAAQAAHLKEAVANMDNLQAQIQKTIIHAPFAGVITQFDGKVGEVVAAGKGVISVMSLSQFEIDANVPEVDIGKVGLGNPVAITLDAFSGEMFEGKVIQINPAETIVDGVVNFKITVDFAKPDPRIKSGLTANLSIQTLKKENVLRLPQYGILETDKGASVKKIVKGSPQETAVQLGIRSQDGLVEIVSGVSEGDSVVNIGSKTP